MSNIQLLDYLIALRKFWMRDFPGFAVRNQEATDLTVAFHNRTEQLNGARQVAREHLSVPWGRCTKGSLQHWIFRHRNVHDPQEFFQLVFIGHENPLIEKDVFSRFSGCFNYKFGQGFMAYFSGAGNNVPLSWMYPHVELHTFCAGGHDVVSCPIKLLFANIAEGIANVYTNVCAEPKLQIVSREVVNFEACGDPIVTQIKNTRRGVSLSI
jgi:hypothetical protein